MSTLPTPPLRFFLALLVLCALAPAHGRCLITVAPGEDVYEAFMSAAQDACSLHLRAGEHTLRERLSVTLSGSPDDPLIVSGDGAENTLLHRPDREQNIIDLRGTHFVVKDLRLRGGSRGLRLEGDTSHARFEHLVIHGTGDAAFTANTPDASYRHIVIRRSEFYDTNGYGECLYLGCNQGACTFADALVTGNYCHDTVSAHGRGQGDGLDLKGGSEAVIVSHNVFLNTYGLGILAYANNGRRPNVFDSNIIVNGSGGSGVQITGDAHLRNNVIILENVKGEAGLIGSPNNQGTPQNLRVLNNTIVRRGGNGRCMAFRNWQGDAPRIVVANNAVYCPGHEALYVRDNPELALIAANAIEGRTNLRTGTYPARSWQEDLIAPFAAANAYPRAGAALIGRANSLLSPARDINCRTRSTPSEVGAFARIEDDNLGWTAGDGFKRCVVRPLSLPPLSAPRLPRP